MIFGLYVYEVLQNIPKTILGWKYIVLFIGLFVFSTKLMRRIIYWLRNSTFYILMKGSI